MIKGTELILMGMITTVALLVLSVSFIGSPPDCPLPSRSSWHTPAHPL